MRIIHIVGARPNFMKVAPVKAALANRKGIDQILIHTGQHYDSSMSAVFFSQLGISQPDFNLEVGSASHVQQTAQIMMRLEPLLIESKPNLVLVYGDINSTAAAALVCSKLLLPVGHVEAGLRSFDRTMPEEINRLITDRLSDYLFTPSADGNENLLHEGTPPERIYLVGNVMIDTLVRLLPQAQTPEILHQLGLEKSPYALVTLHRPSNVDDGINLRAIMETLNELADEIPILFPVHPRTKHRMDELDIHSVSPQLHIVSPVGYLEFLALQKNAALVITDSGGIQEETTFLGIPCLTVRENTERPVTCQLGSNILVGRDMNKLKENVRLVLSGSSKKGMAPPLWDGRASERIADIITGTSFNHSDR